MTAACIVMGVLLLLVIAAALVDVVPAARTWLDRIGIGRMQGDAARERMAAVSLRWLRRTPAVPVSDQTRFTLPERLRGTYASRKIQSWQQAALLLGVSQRGETDAVDASCRSILTPDGNWKQPPDSADTALLAYALLRTAKDPSHVRAAMDTMYMFLRQTVSNGTVPYNARVPHLRFVDALGMVCPFLYLYGKTYDCPEATALCMAQLHEYAGKGLHPTQGLPFHAIRLRDGAQLGICDWGRGCGWYALSLAELMRCGADVSALAQSFAQTILPLQKPDGAFCRQLLSADCGESSATAMLGHFLFAYAETAGDATSRAAAEKALHWLYSVTRRDGTVDLAQGDTKGIGFYSARLVPLPAAQGFALLLAEELR